MDLLAITRKIWRYRLLTLPVVILTLFGAVYIAAIKQPVYQTQTSFSLLNPPPPPTPDEIARDPSLGKINPDNPYTRLGDQTAMSQLLASTLSGESARRALVNAGADPRYTVALSSVGYANPNIQITTAAWTPDIAVRSAKIVGDALTRELDRIQEAKGVAERYRIKTVLTTPNADAQVQASGRLRTLVGVLVLGAVVLFMVVSVTDAFATFMMERRPRVETPGSGQQNEPWPVDPDWPPDPDWQVDPSWQVDPDRDAVATNGRHDRNPQHQPQQRRPV